MLYSTMARRALVSMMIFVGGLFMCEKLCFCVCGVRVFGLAGLGLCF